MSENGWDLTGEIQEQTLSSAEDFFGNSIGSLKRRLENDKSQLQSLLERSPESQEEAYSRLQKFVGSYEDIEYILNRVIQKQGLKGFVEKASRWAPEAEKEISRPATDSLPPGSILLSETTDERDRTVLRSLDESGVIIESVLDESGEPVSEDIVGVISDLTSKQTSEE